MNKTSMISADGSLGLSADRVTWFSFLQFSRTVNSTDGGWHSTSHWSQRGLDVLVPVGKSSGFLATWTANSLDRDALPKPRKRNFQFADREACFKLGHRGEKNSTDSLSENAISWGLYNALKGEKHAVSYEVPLAEESKGQLKVDLMRYVEAGRIEIIELKKSGDDNPDAPLMALTEAICYAIQTIRCWSYIRPEVQKHLAVDPGESLTAINLVLAAPSYWNQCNPKKGKITDIQIEQLHAIVDAVGATLAEKRILPVGALSLTIADIGAKGTGLVRSPFSRKVTPTWSILA